MAGRIRGITIEFSGDTKGLVQSLNNASKATKSIQSALKDVNKLLKLDPKSTELLTQKQNLLKENVEATKKQLEEEQKALEALRNASDADQTVKQQEALARQVEETKNKLKQAEAELQNFGSVGAQKIAAVGEQFKELGGKITAVGEELSKKITGPLLAVGGASIAAFKDVDQGLDTIIKKTGATGQSLAGMEKTFENIAKSIPADMEEIGSAIGQVSTRFKVEGDELENLSTLFLKFAKINGQDVSSAVDGAQKALAAFGLSAKDAEGYLNALNKISQDTGIGVDTLQSGIQQNAAAFQELGLSISQSAIFMGQIELSGAETSTVMSSLTRALKNATKEGKPLNEALGELEDTIVNGKDGMDGLQASYDLFGRSGAQVYNAVKQGKLSFKDLGKAALDASGNINRTFAATQDPVDKFKVALQGLKLTGGELGKDILKRVAPAIDKLSKGIEKVHGWWKKLRPETKDTIIAIAGIAAAAGPLLVVFGKITSGLGGVLTMIPKLVGGFGTLFAFLNANPFVAMSAAAVVAIGGIALALKQAKEEIGPATQAALEFKEANDQAIASVEAQGARMDQLKERIAALNAEQELNTVQREQMKQMVAELNELLGEEIIHIDDETGKTQENTQEIYENIEARKQRALAAAYEEAIAEAAKRAAEAQLALMDAEAALNINTAELSAAEEKLGKAMRDAEAKLDGMTDAQRAAINEERFLIDSTKEEREAVNELIAERADLQAAVADNTEAYNLHIQEMTRMDNASKMSQGVLDDLLKKVGKTASDLSPTLQRGLRDGTYKIPQTVSELNALIKFDEAVQKAGASGSRIARDLQQKMKEGKITVEQAASQLGNAATTGFAKAEREAESTGKNIALGLIRGMESKRQSVGATASAIAGTAVYKMKHTAQVQSPSRLTEYIGAMLDAGLGEGMEGNIKKYITPAVEKVTDALSFQSALNITNPASYGAAGVMQSSAPRIDLSGIYQAVKDGASAATIRSFISGREVTAATNSQNNSDLSGALAFKGAN